MNGQSITLTVISLFVSKTRGAINVPVPEIQLHPNYGIVGDTHAGETRVRSTGEVIPNIGQFTAVHPSDLGVLANALGVPFIDPAWLKANICFACSGIEKFTETLVEGTKLASADGRTVLEIKGATVPCLDAGKYIASQFPHLSVDAQLFPKIAYGRRGVYGITLEDVTIKMYDTFTALLP